MIISHNYWSSSDVFFAALVKSLIRFFETQDTTKWMYQSMKQKCLPWNIWEGGERKLYSLFTFASTPFCIQWKFALKDILSEKFILDIEIDFVRPGKSVKLYNFFFFWSPSVSKFNGIWSEMFSFKTSED